MDAPANRPSPSSRSSAFSFRILNSPRPTSALPVVCALITDAQGRYLLAQRPANKHLGLKWEFPGGKVEANEDPASALRREIREELGADIEILRALPRYTHDYQTVVIEMIPILCRLASASPPPHAHEHVALAWVTRDELARFDLAPADIPLLATLS